MEANSDIEGPTFGKDEWNLFPNFTLLNFFLTCKQL